MMDPGEVSRFVYLQHNRCKALFVSHGPGGHFVFKGRGGGKDMDPVTVGIGVLAIGFGCSTFLLRSTSPSKLKKLETMQATWGEGTGLIVHTVAYSLVPLAVGVAVVFAGLRGVSLF